MTQGFVYGQRVHLAAHTLACFERGLEIVPGDFDGQGVSDERSSLLVVLDPGGMRQSDPHGAAIHQKLDVDGVGVPSGDCHDQSLIHAVNLLLGPAIGRNEVVVHAQGNYNVWDALAANLVSGYFAIEAINVSNFANKAELSCPDRWPDSPDKHPDYR